MEAPHKTKNRATYDLAILLLGIYPRECNSGHNKDTCMPMFSAALLTMAVQVMYGFKKK
jgi:hypothetical protein